jgi:hypothetical protein
MIPPSFPPKEEVLMRLSIGRSVLLVCALLASGAAAPAARGDALSGTLEFQFSGR